MKTLEEIKKDGWESGINQIWNADCLEAMKLIPDKSIDLVLTDPPYGIDADKGSNFYGHTGGRDYNDSWDANTPPIEVFNEILRVSRKAIIFGGQFFADKLPSNGHWIVWDKKGNIQFDNPFGDCELAWTNIDRKSVKKYTIIQQGFIADEKQRYHPTQKPVNLFEAILNDYSTINPVIADLILDPFLGSGTTAIACKRINRRFIGIEQDLKYCKIAENRLKQGVLNF